MTKYVGLHLDLNQGPSKEKKRENFFTKALPLSHGGITLDSDKGTKEFPMEQNVATKYRTCIDISL